MSGEGNLATGVLPMKQPRSYKAYQSPYGPKYTIPKNISGWTLKSATSLGFTLAGFGASFGFFAVYFLSDVPRFRHDLMQKIPIIGPSYIRKVPDSDNPF